MYILPLIMVQNETALCGSATTMQRSTEMATRHQADTHFAPSKIKYATRQVQLLAATILTYVRAATDSKDSNDAIISNMAKHRNRKPVRDSFMPTLEKMIIIKILPTVPGIHVTQGMCVHITKPE